MFKNFEEFKTICEKIANDLHTMVEVHDYNEYGFGTAAFMTDKFGGVYANIKYDFDTNIVSDNFLKENNTFSNYISLVHHIDEQRKKMLLKRNMDEVYDFVNFQY